MNNKELHVRKKIRDILNELKKEEYCINKKQMLELLKLIETLQINVDNKKNDINVFEICTCKNKYIGKIKMENVSGSYILQYPPIIRDNKMVMIKPIMYMLNFNDIDVFDSTLYHELSHVFSIGKWKFISNNQVEHISGISKDIYVYGDHIKRIESNTNCVNEEINDWIAENLYRIIEKKEYKSNKRVTKNKCNNYISQRVNYMLNGNIKKMIGYYFTNNIEMIEQVLLSKEYPSFEKLNSYFERTEKEGKEY